MQSAQFQLHARIEEQHWWFVGRRRILRDVVSEVLPPRSGKMIVDVGCGTGANLAAFAEDYDCVGIDTSQEAISLARQRFPKVRFICGYAPQDLGETAAQADLVLLTDVLEHVPNDRAMLSRLVMSARPGACCLLTVPADMSLWSQHDVSFGHYRRYDLEQLSQVWAGLPVTALAISYFNARLYPAVKAVRTWNRRLRKAAGEAGTDFRLPSRPVNAALERIFAGESRTLIDL
ncbi:MAG: class I SAM-dependent methyltransferase, partial [Planctomycetes bacterium]|nr:class I SAM-dependent methyltransferase [Planctomycetota bacterium]